MATFKEIAEFILSQPEDIQNCEANFIHVGDYDEEEYNTLGLEPDIDGFELSGEKLKLVKVVDRHIAPMIFGKPTCYMAIANGDDELPEEFDYNGF